MSNNPDPLLAIVDDALNPIKNAPLGTVGSSRSSKCQPPHSSSSCPLNLYDKHLAEELRLRYVFHLDTLIIKSVQHLRDEVENGNKERVQLGGSQRQTDLDEFQPSLKRRLVRDSANWVAATEARVRGSAEKVIFPSISAVAARVLFFLLEDSAPVRPIFEAERSTSQHAITDTEFTFWGNNVENILETTSSMRSQTVDILRSSQAAISRLKNAVIALWEWRYFTVLDERTMKGIVEHAAANEMELVPFDWTTCSGPSCPRHEDLLKKAKKHFQPSSSDAPPTLEKFGINMNILRPRPSTLPHDIVEDPEHRGHRSRAAERVAKEENEKRRLKGKKRTAEDDDTFADTETTKQRDVVQQLWSQGVASDLTFLNLSTLNLTLFGLRCRENQSLYISSIQYIEDTDPTLPLASLANLVSAFHDAKARGDLLCEENDCDDPVEGGRTRDCKVGGGVDNRESAHHRSDDFDEHSSGCGLQGGSEGSGGLGQGLGSPFPVVDAITNRAYAQDFFSVRLHLRDMRSLLDLDIGISISWIADVHFLRHLPIRTSCSASSPTIGGVTLEFSCQSLKLNSSHAKERLPEVPHDPPAPSPHLTFCATLPPLLVLTETTECGALGLTFRGFIPYENQQGVEQRVRVIAKVVREETNKRALSHEALVYSSLNENGVTGVPLFIGLFRDVDDDAYVLVTTDVGVSLSSRSSLPQFFANESRGLHNILTTVHDIGWLHGDLRLANVACDAHGRPFLYDFDQAQRLMDSNDVFATRREHRFLEDLFEENDIGCGEPPDIPRQ